MERNVEGEEGTGLQEDSLGQDCGIRVRSGAAPGGVQKGGEILEEEPRASLGDMSSV